MHITYTLQFVHGWSSYVAKYDTKNLILDSDYKLNHLIKMN